MVTALIKVQNNRLLNISHKWKAFVIIISFGVFVTFDTVDYATRYMFFSNTYMEYIQKH